MRISVKGTLLGLEILSLIRQVLEQLQHNHQSEKGRLYCMGEPPRAATRFEAIALAWHACLFYIAELSQL